MAGLDAVANRMSNVYSNIVQSFKQGNPTHPIRLHDVVLN